MENGLIFRNENCFIVSKKEEGYPFGLSTYNGVRLSLYEGFIRIGSPTDTSSAALWESFNFRKMTDDENDAAYTFGKILCPHIKAIVHVYDDGEGIKREMRTGAVVAGTLAGMVVGGPIGGFIGAAIGNVFKKKDDRRKHVLLIQFADENNVIHDFVLQSGLDSSFHNENISFIPKLLQFWDEHCVQNQEHISEESDDILTEQ